MTAGLVRLETAVRWEETPPATHPGRALNAWFYGRLAQVSEAAADALHAERGAKPFTIAIAEAREGLRLVVSGCGELAGLLGGVLAGQERLLLDGRWLVVEGGVERQEDSWGGLASRWLIGDTRPVPVRLDFLSPTTFHSQGRTLPLPVPELVLGGLLQRWQAWSEVDLGEGALATLRDHAAVRRQRTWTEIVQMEGKLTAFRGFAEFTLVRPPGHYAGIAALLGAFAEYAGVGQKVGMGLGCVRARALVTREG